MTRIPAQNCYIVLELSRAKGLVGAYPYPQRVGTWRALGRRLASFKLNGGSSP